jgi:PAS domain S-box-containing protein
LREALDPARFDADLVDDARLFATQAAHAVAMARLHDEMERAHVRAEADRARWRASVENGPEMLVACDTAMRITDCSPAYERTFGRPADLVAPADTWATAASLQLPNAAAPFPFEALPIIRALREHRPVYDIEIAHHAADDTRHLLVWSAAPTRGPRGEVIGAISFGRDVSADRRRAAREACVSAVARAAASGGERAGVEERAARLLDTLARHAGVPLVTASLLLLDAQSGTVTRIGEYRADAVVGAPAPALLADGGRAIWRALTASAQYSDVGGGIPSAADQLSPAWKANAGIRSWAIVPLRAGPILLGALAVGLARRHVWDADERTWLETCADTMGLALENDQLYAAAQRRAGELEAVVEGADAGITLFGVGGEILMRNASAAALTGNDQDSETSPASANAFATASALRDPATGVPVPAEANPVARALRGEVVRDALLLMRDSRGRDRLLQTSCTPVRDASGTVVAAVHFVRDATDQMRRARLFAHLGQALGAILEPGETMRALADALVSIAGIDTVAIYLATPDGEALDLLWARNYPLDGLESVRHIPAGAPSITALALQTGQPQVFQNRDEAGSDEHQLARHIADWLDLGSAAAIPMLARGRVMGVLMAGASQADGFPPEEVALLLDLAAHAGLAMDNARLYQAAHRSAGEQEAIIAAMADPVWVCDADGRLTSVNQAAALMGTAPSAAPGERAGDSGSPPLVWPDGRPVPPGEAPLERARRGEGITGFEAIIQRSDGDAVRLMLSAAPIRDESSGNITGAVSVGHDITVLRQLEHAREEFLAIASHELKTPLTSLLGFVQAARRKESRRLQNLLVAGAAPGGGAGVVAGATAGPTLDLELLGRIERQALRLDRLIGDLLDVARIQQGRMQYRWAEGDVAGAVAEAVDEQRAASPDRRIDLAVPDDPLMARLDADRLRQVVTNLLTNALKYSRAEQPVIVEVTRAASTSGHPGSRPNDLPAAAVRVRDTGPGIPPDHRERIFERFYRVPGLQVQSGSGIGLGVGLFVAREIVERHGGAIWVESDHPKETTFAFTVPLVAAATQP